MDPIERSELSPPSDSGEPGTEAADAGELGEGYLRWSLLIPADLEEVVCADLWQCGCLGIELDSGTQFREGEATKVLQAKGVVGVTVYFAPSGPSDSSPDLLERFLDEWPRVTLCSREGLEERDWLEAYRESLTPIPVGRGFWLDGREPEASSSQFSGVETGTASSNLQDPPDGRCRLILPAKRAFGSGSHETTQIMVEALEDLGAEIKGASVLDVGVGTGVLSFVAERLGAGPRLGFDIDVVSPALALENARLNQCTLSLLAGTCASMSWEARFDVVLVNVLHDRIEKDIQQLASFVRAGGCALVSGVLLTEEERTLASWEAHGLVAERRMTKAEWQMIRFRRPL